MTSLCLKCWPYNAAELKLKRLTMPLIRWSLKTLAHHPPRHFCERLRDRNIVIARKHLDMSYLYFLDCMEGNRVIRSTSIVHIRDIGTAQSNNRALSLLSTAF